MKHIENELIQKYIDNEASREEVTSIDEHLSNCIVCRNEVDEQRKLATEIRGLINNLCVDAIEIPTFNKPENPRKKQHRMIILWSAVAASAACILFCMIFMLKPEKDTPIDSALFLYNTESEFDANRSILQQDFVINIVDHEGNITNYSL